MPPLAAMARVPLGFGASLLPGLAAAIVAAAAAKLLASVTPLPAVFFALVLGMAIGSFAPNAKLGPGMAFASRQVLRLGVALLGAAITFDDILGLGWTTAVITIGALAATLVAGTWLAQRLGERREAAIVSAAAVAICGASASLAVAAALPKGSVKDEEVARVIAGITVIGTVALLLYPLLARVMALSPEQTGIFLGGSIHEVAQASAAGFAVSVAVGKVATIVKMLRVACMSLVVIGVSAMARRDHPPGDKPPLVPLFLVGFVALAAVSSAGLIPAELKALVVDFSRWCLLIAIAALGAKTNARTLVTAGASTMIIIVLNSVLLAALVLGGIWLVQS